MVDILNSFGVDYRLLIMQAINFLVLLTALTYFLYKPLTKMIAERKQKIEKGLQDAYDAKVRLEKADDKYNQIVAEATNKASEIITKAKDISDEKSKEIIGIAEERASDIEKNAILKAEEDAKKIINESNDKIARTAILAAERLLRKKLN